MYIHNADMVPKTFFASLNTRQKVYLKGMCDLWTRVDAILGTLFINNLIVIRTWIHCT